MNNYIHQIRNLLNNKHEFFSQGIKYLSVGGLSAIVDFFVLFVLVQWGGINYLWGAVLGFMAGTILNYFLCITWIFKESKIENRYHEFLYYVVISGVGLGLNTLLIWIFTEFAGFYFMWSKVFATGITMSWNFLARKYFLHSLKPESMTDNFQKL